MMGEKISLEYEVLGFDPNATLISGPGQQAQPEASRRNLPRRAVQLWISAARPTAPAACLLPAACITPTLQRQRTPGAGRTLSRRILRAAG